MKIQKILNIDYRKLRKIVDKNSKAHEKLPQINSFSLIKKMKDQETSTLKEDIFNESIS